MTTAAVTLSTQAVQVKMASVGLLPGGVKPANVLLPGDVKSRGIVECEHFTLTRLCDFDRKLLRCETTAIPLASSPRIKENAPSENTRIDDRAAQIAHNKQHCQKASQAVQRCQIA